MKPQQILELEKAWEIEIRAGRYVLNENGEVIKLNLSHNQIKDLSPLSNLNKVTELDLRNNQIAELNPLSHLSKIIKLNLSNNQIIDISPLSHLSKVTELNLSDNRITDFSPLYALSNIIELALSNNQITDFNLYALNNLTSLDLGKNQINDLSSLKDFTQLKELDASHNLISDISFLNELKDIEKINLSNNQIFDIRPIRKLLQRNIAIEYNSYARYCINLYENPLEEPLINLIQASLRTGKQPILAYLDNLDKEAAKGKRPINEAKMIVLGNVGAGKSSLVNYLVGKPFVETKSTEGFRIERWEIEDDIDKYRINVWDFGGDEIQQTLHRFFLTQNCLYVVVVDARYEQNPNQYLEEIKSYAPNSPVIVVVNRTDQKYWGVDEAQLLANYRLPSGEPMIKGFFKTSVLEAHKELNPHFLPALNALDAAIVQQLLAMPTLREPVPSNYFEVKCHLESQFFKDTPYITHDLYEQLCRDKNLELASDDSLLSILNRLGTIRYFDKSHTRNLHILNPAWLSDGVYRILTAEHTHNLRGVISEKDFARILYKSEHHVFDYPKQHYGYLIEMIRQFYLGYVQPDTEKIFIPQAFGSDYPASFSPEDYKTNALHFFFRYETFIPAGAISSFIARTFGQVQGSLYWQKGIVISNKTETALVMQTDIKNRIDIWVQGEDRREFFITIRQIFREFHERYIALQVDEMVGLDARRDTSVKYKVLIAHKHKGKADYTDEEGNDYNIDALLGSFETPAATQQAITNNFYRDYYDMRGAKHIQFIRKEAQAISADLNDLMAQSQEMSEANKALLDKLIADLGELQKAESPKQAKGAIEQLKETRKNWVKIASEESVKWATKTGLDQIPFKEKFNFIQEKIVNLLQDNRFQDFVKSDNWA